MPGLRTIPSAPAASTLRHDRADVVRILDTVEHDDQRRACRARRSPESSTLRRAFGDASSATTPWCARRSPRDRGPPRSPLDADCPVPPRAARFSQPLVGARRHAQRGHALRAKRLENGVDAVDRIQISDFR
jgi:hypothetical protein